MLILVGVTVTVSLNGGLFKTAQDAADKTHGKKQQEVELSNGRVKIGGVWYDSLEAYERGEESVNQEETALQVGLYKTDGTFVPWDELIADGTIHNNNGIISTNYGPTIETWMGMQMTVYRNSSSDILNGDLVVPGGADITLAENAFASCGNLRSVTFADNVVDINKYAFANCSALVSIDLSKSTRLTTIKKQLVANCNVLESIKLPSSITTIEEGAIASHNSLTDFEIGHMTNLTTIEYDAISCGATIVDIPASVQTIEEGAFNYWHKLEEINVDSANPNYCSVDGVLFTKDMNTLIHYPESKQDTQYTVPNGVTTIAYEAFSDTANLKTVILPSSITTIANRAFMDATSIEVVTIENCTNLTSLGNYTFQRLFISIKHKIAISFNIHSARNVLRMFFFE